MLATWLFVSLLSATSLAQDYGWDVLTPLDNYVNFDDGYYNWTLLDTYYYFNDTVTVYILNMTSQKYSDTTFTDCDIWWHYMGVAVPKNPAYTDAAAMLIDGGSNRYDGNYPTPDDTGNVGIAAVAQATGIISGYIKQIPNQPCIFNNDPNPHPRSEDHLIAWTWRTFVDDPNHNPYVVARLPMTKGAKRGLDAIHDSMLALYGFHINRFLVTGASKRGWTTWSLGAVDRRVIAIAPIVFSLINMPQSVMAHYRAMDGAYSFALDDYYNENLTQYLTNPLADLLWDLEDIYRYRSRFTMPKLYVGGTNDEFFHPQETRFWWNDFPDPKNMFMCRNGDHAMVTCWLEVGQTIGGFFVNVLSGVPMPVITWTRETTSGVGGKITLTTDLLPVESNEPDSRCDGEIVNRTSEYAPFTSSGYLIRGHTATTLATDNRRDFRLLEGYPEQTQHLIVWKCANNSITKEAANVFSYEEAEVEGEWVGFLIEGQWDGPIGHMYLTSEVNIVPDTYPAEPCVDYECRGILV